MTEPQTATILPIPLFRVRSFTGQPRRWFDPVALRELADSILEVGQRTPAWVTPEDEDGTYRLIAGERRLRACRLAGLQTILCEIRPAETEELRYVDSVLENFGRADCTVLEKAHAIQRIAEIYLSPKPHLSVSTLQRVGRIFGRSSAWVQQHRALLNLCPEVQALLEPPARLPFLVAVTLSNLRHGDQLRLADHIITHRLHFKSALAYVRGERTEEMRVKKHGRLRRPSDDLAIFTRFLSSIGRDAEALLAIPITRRREMFEHRPVKDLHTFQAVVRRRAEQLLRLAENL